jgi:hypothetical protein
MFGSPLAGCNGQLPQFLELSEAPEAAVFATGMPLVEDESESGDFLAGFEGGGGGGPAELGDE